ncbi:hypothetical protein [Elioraea sp.]|uniref:hypothetical protein n=1 Tax=Elioraea sp. TaxID=2185103 RepID=UPI003F71508A
MAVSIERQIACVEREIALRRRAYPRWVQAGRMTQRDADREFAEMEAVLATLRGLKAEVEPVML